MRRLTDHTFLDVRDLGAGVPYGDGLAAMRTLTSALAGDEQADAGTLLLLEHAPTITVTKSGGLTHVRASAEELARDGFELCEADRGGDVTFHGPGQLVGYPVLRLCDTDDGRADLVGYLHTLEGALVRACATLGVEGCHTRRGMTGVWVGDGPDDDNGRKLVALGVGVRRGVTRHGFALNRDIDLDAYTARITPCGLTGRGVTSLAQELGHERLPDAATVRDVVTGEISRALGLGLRTVHPMVENPDEPGAVGPDGAFHV